MAEFTASRRNNQLLRLVPFAEGRLGRMGRAESIGRIFIATILPFLLLSSSLRLILLVNQVYVQRAWSRSGLELPFQRSQ